jgi:hypothetical protein
VEEIESIMAQSLRLWVGDSVSSQIARNHQ